MLEDIRNISLAEAKRLGYPTNRNLPTLDIPECPRDLSAIGRRLLALYAVVSCSYGFPKERAKHWLRQEGLLDALSSMESDYLNDISRSPQNTQGQWQVEGLWTLAWAAGRHDIMDFSSSCAENFVQMLPDIKNAASSRTFQNELKLRAETDLLKAADLAYCLHWAIRDAELNGNTAPGLVPPEVVIERRRALEWMLGDEYWDDVNLDT